MLAISIQLAENGGKFTLKKGEKNAIGDELARMAGSRTGDDFREMTIVGKSRSAIVSSLFAAIVFLASPATGAMTPPRLKPPPPGPVYVDQSDLGRLKAIKEAISRRQYPQARTLAKALKDPTARSLGDWYYFDAEDPLVPIAEADAFLDAHPEWPSVAKIQTHIEKRLAWTTAPATILELFKSRDPLTGEGKIHLARAQIATGAPEAGDLHVKDAWIRNNFILADEQRVLANYGGRLSADDHAARVDRLLWAREVSTAKRVFSRLRAEDRRRAEARAALLLGGSDGPRLYDALGPEDRADPGVMLAAVRYYRRAEEEPRAMAIVRNAPTDAAALRDAARWWDEQQLLMRWALKNRQYADAYAAASHHGLEPGGADFAEAEFNAGWIALRYLNDPARAEKHFGALTAAVSAPISLSRGWYWLGRAAEAKGEANIATARYAKAAEQIYTFYGQLAAEKLGGDALMRTFEEGSAATPEEKARFGSRPSVAALRMLTDLRDDRAFLIFAYHVDDALASRGEFRELADLAMRMNAPHVAVRAGKVAVRTGSFAADIAYPEISVPDAATRFAPPEVILGLSRQESEFNPRAYSLAGARGMMQLIPSTAQATARKERIAYRQSALLDDPHYNMTLGSAHLSHLIDRFGGSWIMTFAGYNAGVNRVAQWVEAYGDPRGQGVDPLDWIEQIPFEETRNYVQRVLENSQIYRSRLTKSGLAGKLASDIERGGSSGRVAATPAISAPGALPDVQPRIAAIAEKLLSPVVAAAETSAALSHVRVKPPTSTVREKERTTPTPTRGGRRPSFRLRKAAPSPDGEHDEAARPIPPPPAAATTAITPTPAALPPLLMDPVDGASDASLESEAAYTEEALVDDAPSPIESLAVDAAATAECMTYSDFIARTAREEASADDLNAGGLAELKSGTDACK